MKKITFFDANNKIEVHNLKGDWLELWERGVVCNSMRVEGAEVRVIDDCLMVVDIE
jgi:hypothetical protein